MLGKLAEGGMRYVRFRHTEMWLLPCTLQFLVSGRVPFADMAFDVSTGPDTHSRPKAGGSSSDHKAFAAFCSREVSRPSRSRRCAEPGSVEGSAS